MTGGGKQSASDRQAQGYQRGLAEYNPNVDPVSIQGPKQSNLNIGFYKGWEAAGQQAQQEQSMMQMFANMMHGMSSSSSSSGPSYEDQMAQQQAEYDRRMEEQRIAEGRAKRDSLYSNYLTAATSATDYINTQVQKERSNAALLGIDYNIDDEVKSTRISNYFASIWGEGEQAELEQTMSEFGNPKGFTDWTVKRGIASGPAEGGEETLVGTSKGRKPTDTSLVDDEEGFLLGA